MYKTAGRASADAGSSPEGSAEGGGSVPPPSEGPDIGGSSGDGPEGSTAIYDNNRSIPSLAGCQEPVNDSRQGCLQGLADP